MLGSVLRDELLLLRDEIALRGLALDSELSSLIEGAVRAAPVKEGLALSRRIREWDAGDVLLDEGGSESGGESGELCTEKSEELALLRPGTEELESGKDKSALRNGER